MRCDRPMKILETNCVRKKLRKRGKRENMKKKLFASTVCINYNCNNHGNNNNNNPDAITETEVTYILVTISREIFIKLSFLLEEDLLR